MWLVRQGYDTSTIYTDVVWSSLPTLSLEGEEMVYQLPSLSKTAVPLEFRELVLYFVDIQ